MTAAQARPRWLLHPVAATLFLVVGGVFATVMALTVQRDLAAAGALLLLAAVAGAAAGFANSGST